MQRRVVLQPQILPKPNNDTATHRRLLVLRVPLLDVDVLRDFGVPAARFPCTRAAAFAAVELRLTGAFNSNFGGSLRFSRNIRRSSGSSAAQSTLSRCMRRNC